MQRIGEKIKVYLGTCLSYLIKDEKRVLIDAGSLVFPVDLLILTHAHFDHLYYAKEIIERSNCKVACGEREVEHLEKLTRVTLKELSAKELTPLKVGITLKEGDLVDCGELKLRVIETPGHSPGSISLYEPKLKILFSGDTLFGGESYGRVDLPGGNEQELKNSLKKLRKLEVKILCPGH